MPFLEKNNNMFIIEELINWHQKPYEFDDFSEITFAVFYQNNDKMPQAPSFDWGSIAIDYETDVTDYLPFPDAEV